MVKKLKIYKKKYRKNKIKWKNREKNQNIGAGSEFLIP